MRVFDPELLGDQLVRIQAFPLSLGALLGVQRRRRLASFCSSGVKKRNAASALARLIVRQLRQLSKNPWKCSGSGSTPPCPLGKGLGDWEGSFDGSFGDVTTATPGVAA